MNYTSTHQFNLIEVSDTFSPEPLNENMEKVELALAAADEALAQTAATLTAAIGTAGKTARVAFGTYQGLGRWGQTQPNSITVPFRPLLAAVAGASGMHLFQVGKTQFRLIQGVDSATNVTVVEWLDNGLSWYSQSADVQLDALGKSYSWVALGYEDGEN